MSRSLASTLTVTLVVLALVALVAPACSDDEEKSGVRVEGAEPGD